VTDTQDSAATQPVTGGRQAGADRMVPMRRQYLQIKQRFPDTILLFRLGDFYETFEEDAEATARVLDIVLTSREMGKGVRVPMAGIPHHASEGHIARLVAAGHKVAICEQISEPTKGRGIVERDVTRVVTPGTVTEPSMLDSRRNTYVAAVAMDGHRAGLAYADVSTGEFRTTQIVTETPADGQSALHGELLRIGAAEVVLPLSVGQGAREQPAWVPERVSQSFIEPWRCTTERATEALQRHFMVDSLDGYGCSGLPLAIQAAGALLTYLQDTQRSSLEQMRSLATYSTERFMSLDAQTRRNLELTESGRGERRHSLVAVLDQTLTPMGARLLRTWIGQPLLDLDELSSRQDAVERLVSDPMARSSLRQALKTVADLERLANRAITGSATPRDLAALRASLVALPGVLDAAGNHPAGAALAAVATPCAAVAELLESAVVDEPPAVLGKGGVIRPGFAPELDAHESRAREAREWIAGLERSERERTGIRSLKVGYNKVFGYYLEISAGALATAERDRSEPALPEDYIAKQTLANATRYFTPRLKEFETIVLTAEETLAAIESDVFRRVVRQTAGTAADLLTAAAAIANLDVLATLAEVAALRNYVRPALDGSGVIEIEDGRHPTLEAVLPAGEFVPNNAHLDCDGAQITILTGPNMAGKSSWLRQVALIVLMAQIGSFVPARSARIGMVDRIFTRIGAQDDIATGQSTFMVEMLETANILNNATPRSLVVLDEIGRGTSTYDGLAIARAIVEHLHNAPNLGCRTLFATHYHELTELESILPRVRACRMDVLEDGDAVVFLRRVVAGGADRSYGIHVAQLAGIPRAIVRRAQDILADLEADSHPGQRQDRRDAMRSPAPGQESSIQLTLFAPPHPAIDALRQLDIESLSPLEAITELFELRKLARDDGGA
jgi:DNA mismatch repair protein MutS